MSKLRQYYSTIEQLMDRLKGAGLEDAAADLPRALQAATTTSSEAIERHVPVLMKLHASHRVADAQISDDVGLAVEKNEALWCGNRRS
jgi:hypothetical protein